MPTAGVASHFQCGDQKLKKLAYLLTPEGLHHRLSLTCGYLERKTRQYEALHAELASLCAELAAGEGSGQPVDPRQPVNPGLDAGPPADTTNP